MNISSMYPEGRGLDPHDTYRGLTGRRRILDIVYLIILLKDGALLQSPIYT